MIDGATISLFIFSPDDPDGLCTIAEGLGWQVIFARHTLNAEASFLTSDARIALVDVRGAADSVSRVRWLASDIESIGGALIVVGDELTADSFGELVEAGATHFLPAPVTARSMRVAVDSAKALVRRLSDEKTAYGTADLESVSGGTMLETDYLTGLAGRRAALDWLGEALQRDEIPPVCLLVGISQFDAVNAAYGQEMGDAILTRMAQRILRLTHAMVGRECLIARVAGTEFLIGLRAAGHGNEKALRLARHLVEEVGAPFVADDQQIRITARCGIAEGLPADDSPRLLRRAAAALADARRSGAGDICLRITDKAGRGRGLDLDQLDADLRLALGRGEIGVVFQPQYDALTDRIVGVEALARWNHPQFGELGAATLFDVADRSDFLAPLSRHIQREALGQAANWPVELADIRLSINVTAVDLARDDFVSSFLAMVADSGFPAKRLTVEITESGLIENIAIASSLLTQLREGGIRVAMDDFGTGYSSLAYLKALHLDYLKIDSGLTRDIEGAPRDRIIVRGIIDMAKSLSLKVVAEGVESETQLTLLAREGCDVYQGFLRSAGVTGQELVSMIRQQP